MKKRLISFILTLTMLLSIAIVLPVSTAAVDVWDGSSSSAFEGEGTMYSPYIIRNAQNLKSLQEQVAAGNNFAGKYIVLANDIDLGAHEWTPIGSRGTDKTSFSGVFDGNGFTIKGLSITSYTQYSGLFGVVAAVDAYDAVIANLIVEGSIVFDESDNFSGGLFLGGISSWTESAKKEDRVIITDCVSKVDITINKPTTGTQDPYIGGVVGRVGYADFIDCAYEGNIDIDFGGSTKILRAGGVVGANYNGTYLNCVNKGTISVYQNSADKYLDYIGGVMGLSATAASGFITTMTNCANFGEVTAENAVGKRVRVGGIIGSFYSNNTTIENCYNMGTVTGKMGESTTDYAYVGGITGHFDKDGAMCSVIIRNSYNSGTIYSIGGKGDRAGGIVGVGYTYTTSTAPSTVENCQTTTEKYISYGPGVAVNCTANISTETFNALIAPIDLAISTGNDYDISANIATLGAEISITTAFRGSARLVAGSTGLRFTTEIKNSFVVSYPTFSSLTLNTSKSTISDLNVNLYFY